MIYSPSQKISFVKLHLFRIISGSHKAYGSSTGQSGYTYHSHQHENK